MTCGVTLVLFRVIEQEACPPSNVQTCLFWDTFIGATKAQLYVTVRLQPFSLFTVYKRLLLYTVSVYLHDRE